MSSVLQQGLLGSLVGHIAQSVWQELPGQEGLLAPSLAGKAGNLTARGIAGASAKYMASFGAGGMTGGTAIEYNSAGGGVCWKIRLSALGSQHAPATEEAHVEVKFIMFAHCSLLPFFSSRGSAQNPGDVSRVSSG